MRIRGLEERARRSRAERAALRLYAFLSVWRRICALCALLGVVLFLAGIARAGGGRSYIIAAHRDGEIEFIDPTMLKTVSRIQIVTPAESVGLNGIFVSPDSSTLYFEGPIGTDPNVCCWLYSLDLRTLQTKEVGDVWGTREDILIADGVVYTIAGSSQYAKFPNGNGRWHFSPDHKWLAGVGGWQRALDLFDVSRGNSTAHSGRVLELRPLDPGYWWIVAARFAVIPENGAIVSLPQ